MWTDFELSWQSRKVWKQENPFKKNFPITKKIHIKIPFTLVIFTTLGRKKCHHFYCYYHRIAMHATTAHVYIYVWMTWFGGGDDENLNDFYILFSRSPTLSTYNMTWRWWWLFCVEGCCKKFICLRKYNNDCNCNDYTHMKENSWWWYIFFLSQHLQLFSLMVIIIIVKILIKAL